MTVATKGTGAAGIGREARRILGSLGIEDAGPGGFAGEWIGSGPPLEVFSPIDGSRLAAVNQVSEAEYDLIVERAQRAFREWRTVPAPRRGEVVRQLGERLRANKEALGALVTLEMARSGPRARAKSRR